MEGYFKNFVRRNKNTRTRVLLENYACSRESTIVLKQNKPSAFGAGGRGFDPRPGHTKDFKKMVVMAALLDAQNLGLALQLVCRCQDKVTSCEVQPPRVSVLNTGHVKEP